MKVLEDSFSKIELTSQEQQILERAYDILLDIEPHVRNALVTENGSIKENEMFTTTAVLCRIVSSENLFAY